MTQSYRGRDVYYITASQLLVRKITYQVHARPTDGLFLFIGLFSINGNIRAQVVLMWDECNLNSSNILAKYFVMLERGASTAWVTFGEICRASYCYDFSLLCFNLK